MMTINFIIGGNWNSVNGCLKRTNNISINERIVDRDLLEVTSKPKDCIVYASNYRGVMCNVFASQCRQRSVFDKWNISVIMCDTDIP
jgi:hypothetical protein